MTKIAASIDNTSEIPLLGVVETREIFDWTTCGTGLLLSRARGGGKD